MGGSVTANPDGLLPHYDFLVPGELSPTGRALKTLDLLQAEPGLTSTQLAGHLEVTERAARRYIALLREADIPVESSRGRYGGYRLGRGRRPAPLRFSADEALCLVMAVLDGHHAVASAEDPVSSALFKLISALPEKVGEQAATMRRYAAAAPDRTAARPDPEISSSLVDAVAAERRVRIRYRSEVGNDWEEEVDPWAVVVRHGRWYLLCHSHRAEAVRAYRIDRIHEVAGCEQRFRAPADLDCVALLEQHLGHGWPYQTRVLFDAPLDEVAPFVGPPMGSLEPAQGGARCLLTGTTNNPAMYAGEWLAAIPIRFRVEGGPELRQAVRTVAGRLGAAVDARLSSDTLDPAVDVTPGTKSDEGNSALPRG